MAISQILFGALLGQTISDIFETAVYGEFKAAFVKEQAIQMQKISGANALKSMAQM